MKRLFTLLLTILCILAVSAQTLRKDRSESAGIFTENSSGESANQDNGSDNSSNSGFFRAGGNENNDDGGGATKEGELPSDEGNGVIIVSILFAAFYGLVRIRKNKRMNYEL